MPKNVFAGVGISRNEDAYKAGKEAVEQAMEEMKKQGGKKPTFGLVFCSGGKYGKDDKTIQKLVDGAHSVFNDTSWVGCTTAGEISNYGATTSSCVALVLSSEYIHVGVGVGENVTKNPKEAGIKATKTAWKLLQSDRYVDSYLQYLRVKKRSPDELVKMNPFSMIVLGKGPEGGILAPTLPDNESVLDGINEVIGSQVPIIGGISADDWRIKKNYHFANGKVFKDAVIVAALMSHIYSSSGMAHGYTPTEKFLLVNKVKDSHMVIKMNNKPAIEAYSELTGVSVRDVKKSTLDVCIKYPLGVVDPHGEFWLRVPGATFLNSLFMSAKVTPNTIFHLMKGNKNDVLGACKDAVNNALKIIEKRKIAFALVFSCALRAKLLGEDVKKEIEILRKSIGDVPIIGFYTFGEFGGLKGRMMGLHNQTVTVLVFSDELMT